jgi:hypothetical protein
MPGAIGYVRAGQIFTPDYVYDPRWTYGSDGSLRVISMAAAENIPPGVMVQSAGPGRIQVARSTNQLVGVVTFNPAEFLADWEYYQQGDMVPVVRRGQVFCRFLALQPPFSAPGEYSPVYFYPGPWVWPVPANTAAGYFTTDKVGTFTTPKVNFALANKDYYQTSDGSPAADYPYPVPPIPVGSQDTTFGDSIALAEVNLG